MAAALAEVRRYISKPENKLILAGGVLSPLIILLLINALRETRTINLPPGPTSTPGLGAGGGAEVTPTPDLNSSPMPMPTVAYGSQGCYRWVDGKYVNPGYQGEKSGAVCLGLNRWFVPDAGGGKKNLVVKGPPRPQPTKLPGRP